MCICYTNHQPVSCWNSQENMTNILFLLISFLYDDVGNWNCHHRIQGPDYRVRSFPWPLRTWRHQESGQQRPLYWSCPSNQYDFSTRRVKFLDRKWLELEGFVKRLWISVYFWLLYQRLIFVRHCLMRLWVSLCTAVSAMLVMGTRDCLGNWLRRIGTLVVGVTVRGMSRRKGYE